MRQLKSDELAGSGIQVSHPFVIRIDPRRWAWAIGVASVLIIALGLSREWLVASGMTTPLGANLDAFALNTSDMSVVNWYQPILLAGLALFAYVASSAVEGRADRLRWATVGVAFLLMSFDESVNLHRLALWPLRVMGTDGQIAAMALPVIPAVLLAAVAAPLLKKAKLSMALAIAGAFLVYALSSIALDSAASYLFFVVGDDAAFVSISFSEEAVETLALSAAAILMLLAAGRQSGLFKLTSA